MKKINLVLLLSLVALPLASCGEEEVLKPKTYTISWVDYDGALLETDKDVKEGEMPHFDGETPTRKKDDNFTYTFKEWSPKLEKVTKDATYKAVYSETPIPTYTVTWVNYNDEVLEVDINVKEGETPHFDGVTPTRASDTSFTYTFKEWSPKIAPVTQNVTYKATFTSTPIVPDIKTYTVTWVNYNDQVLEVDSNVEEGTMPQYNGQTPIKPSDAEYNYIFKERTPALKAVTENITYKATFTSERISNVYHIKFVNYNDDLLYEADVNEGETATYKGVAPTKPEDDEFTYEFTGWDKELTNISSSFTTKAQYKPVAKENWGPIHWF